MPVLTFVKAEDLRRWAELRDAQSALPILVRRLIAATARVTYLNFPGEEEIQLPGWDGLARAQEGSAFVPEGPSGWELSTEHSPKGKAQSDYDKRTADASPLDPPKSSFLFVTPRRWSGGHSWADDRRAEKKWRDVRVYDAGGLVQWLELAPAVHVWLSTRLGKQPEAAEDLEHFFANWAESTQPALSVDFLLAGRKDAVTEIRRWLGESAGNLRIQSESREEALAAFVAAIKTLPIEEQTRYLARSVVVRNESAWNELARSKEQLTLVPLFDVGGSIAAANRNGHKILLVFAASVLTPTDTLVLPPIGREDASKALVGAGVESETAPGLVALGRRSFMSLRRKLAREPGLRQPIWAHSANGEKLVPLMLAGAWSEAVAGDKEALGKLADTPYEAFEGVINPWRFAEDPPARRIGETWFVVSREDAWTLLSRFLTRKHIERFQALALEVLGVSDPSWDEDPNDRWLRALRKRAAHSGTFRKSLAETLAIMGSRGSAIEIGGASAADYAARIVRILLERANTDWRLWATLADCLPFLAEAAPDDFLNALDAGLNGETPPVRRLFTDGGDSSSPHVHLLWALESLAWSPDYIGRVALMLARLTKIDPGGTLMNRPARSLSSIFRPRCPQTAAPLEQRVKILDLILEREPDVGWGLLTQLLPMRFGAWHLGARPQFRDWAVDSGLCPPVSEREYFNAVSQIVDRLLSLVGHEAARWTLLLNAVDDLPAADYDKVVDEISRRYATAAESPDRTAIWSGLRQLIARHRSHPTAGWVLPQDQISKLESLNRTLEPRDFSELYSWLFENEYPDIPEPFDDVNARDEQTASARLEAIRRVCVEGGLVSLLAFARSTKQPGLVGEAVGRTELLDGAEDDGILERLGDSSTDALFAKGFAVGRIATRGRSHAEARLPNLTPVQRVDLLLCLPQNKSTWSLVDKDSADVQQRYWKTVHPYAPDLPADVAYVSQRLLEYQRPWTAVHLLAMHVEDKQPPPSELIAAALTTALKASPALESGGVNLDYYVAKLLDTLEATAGFDMNIAASLEWQLVPLLRYSRPPRLLVRELTQKPDFFAHIVSLVVRGDNEPNDDQPTDDDKARALAAHNLLTDFRTVPGTRDDGTIDSDALTDWVREARRLLSQSGRLGYGDQAIGEALSGAPSDPDGAWPSKAVRDVIEKTRSDDIETGFRIAVFNSRGVVTKSVGEGGDQEQRIAQRYEELAGKVRDESPRTAALLRLLAKIYMGDATSEDLRASIDTDWQI